MIKKTLLFLAAVTLLGAGCTSTPHPTPKPDTQTPVTQIPVGTPSSPELAGQVVITNTVILTHPIHNPVTVTGEAKGWYFEASFPVKILNASHAVIGEGHVTATSDWMVDAMVPFTATVSYAAQPSGSMGYIRFEKDNPSGLPENDGSMEFPVHFE